MADIRSLQRPVFWEVFSGMAVLTACFRRGGVSCATPIDAAANPEFNLLNANWVALVVGILLAHLIDLLHIAPPCASFSWALNGSWATQLRTMEFPAGIDGLTTEQMRQVRIGNALAQAAATIMQAQSSAGNMFQLEQPGRSLMVEFAPMKDTLKATEARGYERDACADGAPWRKPLILYTATRKVGRSLVALCPG